MCGLIGMVGTLEYKHKCVMKDLFFLNTLRGKDSTGLSSVDRDRGVLTRKMTVPGYDFIELPIVEKAMKHRDQLWIGHGRYKTTGEVNRQNAHPFEVLDDQGDILLIGAHNGTLNNKFEIERKLDEKFDTDSEALFNLMVEAPNYKEAISRLRGAWSLVWWDPTTDTINFCRNKERPMTFAFTKDRRVMIWASEAWMIVNACRRNGLELAQNERGLSCASTLEDHLYSMEIPQKADAELPELIREGGYTGAPVHNFQGHVKDGFRRWSEWWDEDNESNKGGEKKTEEGKKESKADAKETGSNVVSIGEPKTGIKGFGGKIITLNEACAIKDKGCAWCKEKIPTGIVFAFLSEEHAVCARCLRDSHPKARYDDGDVFDDDLPIELTDKGDKARQEDSPEYKTLIAASVTKAVG